MYSSEMWGAGVCDRHRMPVLHNKLEKMEEFKTSVQSRAAWSGLDTTAS